MGKKISLLLLVLLPGGAIAHDFLTDILTVNDKYHLGYQVAVNYSLSENDILVALNIKRSNYDLNKLVKRSSSGDTEEYRRVNSSDCEFAVDTMMVKTCGAFDHFSRVRVVAIDMCGAFALRDPLAYPDGLIPQFVGPKSFVYQGTAPAGHHQNYRFADGVEFNCVKVIKKAKQEK